MTALDTLASTLRELRLRSWPGDGEEPRLARGGYHLRPIEWLGRA